MKILQLDLRAFGPFTNVSLDLSEGHQGLHLIYGPNEAGKSSALRALRQMFYGIPNNSSDNFRHPYPNLRIGATLRNGDGEELRFLRRKGNKNTLRREDDTTVLDEAGLRAFLGGIDQAMFESMFGLNHAKLVEGGRAIVSGGGDIGQILFAAGSGIANLHAIQRKLDEETDKLFKPGGQNPAINQSFSELERVRKKIKETALPSSEWVAHDQALRQAQSDVEVFRRKLQDLQREKHRLERLKQAIPLLTQRQQLSRELSDFGPVTILPPVFSNQRREAVMQLMTAQSAEKRVLDDIADIDDSLNKLVVSELLLEEAVAIEQLSKDLGSYEKAQRDRPKLRGQQDQLEADALAVLRELRPDVSLNDAEQLRLNNKQQVDIQNLGNRHGALLTHCDQAQRTIDRLTSEIDTAQRLLQELDAQRDAEELRRAVHRVRKQGDLDGLLTSARDELSRLQRQSAIDLKKLTLWSGTLEDLESLPVLASETIDRFQTDFRETEQTLTNLQTAISDAKRDRSEAEQKIQQLQLAGEVPSEGELADSRRRRDEGWRLVRQAWETSEPDAGRVREFVEDFGLGQDLAGAYEQSVRSADEVSDRLRREADRVAIRATQEATRQKHQQQMDTLQPQQQRAQVKQDQIQQEWVSSWRPLGISPLLPREMQVWLRKHSELTQKAATQRKQREVVDKLTDRITTHRLELSELLQQLEESPTREGESLAALLDKSQAVVDQIESTETTRKGLAEKIRESSRHLPDARKNAEQVTETLVEWRKQWTAAVQPLGLLTDATPAQANEVLAQITGLLGKIRDIRDLAIRISGIDQDADRFRHDVSTLAARVSPDLATLPVEQAAMELQKRLKQSTADKQARDNFTNQQAKKKEKELDPFRVTIVKMTAKLKVLCQEAGCDDPDDLPKREQISADVAKRRDDIQRLDEQLSQLSGGATLEQLAEDAEAVVADDLPTQITRLTETLDQLETERAGLNQTIGSEQTELKKMDGSSVAAEAAEQVQQLLARIASDATEYTRLRLASAVLREGIERYREKNQGPVLKRAGELFSRLTRGSFESLRGEYEDKDSPVLVGVRPGGQEHVGEEGMSEGTCDPLYLALRLASLESYIDSHTPLPFIVDDILIKLDNDRAIATLQVLAELSKRTQVILFTHHQHLVDLAQTTLESDVLFTHRLDR